MELICCYLLLNQLIIIHKWNTNAIKTVSKKRKTYTNVIP